MLYAKILASVAVFISIVGSNGATLPEDSLSFDNGSVASPNFDALVNFKGQLLYKALTDSDEEQKPQKLSKVNTEVIPDLADGKLVKMQLSDVEFALSSQLGFLDDHYLFNATLKFSEKIQDEDECILKNLVGAYYNLGQHYFCGKEMKYECRTSENKYLATLIVEKLEFEIDGDAKKVKEGHFSTTKSVKC